MTLEIFLVTLSIIVTLVLFASERFSVGINALIVLTMTMALGVFFPDTFPSVPEGLSGFANSATITIFCMFILSAGIEQTGVLQQLSKKFRSFGKRSYLRTFLIIALITIPASAIVNNTAVVAILIPFVLDIARKNNIMATRLMMPLSFLSMTAGMITLLGSSTNILSNSLMIEVDPNTPSLGIFSISLIGLLGVSVCFLYFLSIGRWLLPNRISDQERLETPEFMLEILLEKNNPFLEKTLQESKFGDQYNLRVLQLTRKNRNYEKDFDQKPLQLGDILLIKIREKSLAELLKQNGLRIVTNFDETERRRSLQQGKIVKAVFISNVFRNLSIKKIDFLETFGVTLIGLNHTKKRLKRLKETLLRTGQTFLLQMTSRRFERFKNSDHFLFLDTIEQRFHPEKLRTTLIIMAFVILIPAFTPVPIVITALLGVASMVLLRCVDQNNLFNSVHWDIVFLIAGLVPLGITVQKSGVGEILAFHITQLANGMSPFWIFILFYAFTSLTTEFISNTAAVVLIIPIAISTAHTLGISPQAITVVIMFAASMSMISPFGYQTNAMIYRAANYRFFDFARVGLPLNIILMFTTCWATMKLFL